MEQKLITDFTEYMQNIFNEKESYFDKGVHCSSLGMCKKQVVLDYYKFEKKEKGLGQMLRLYTGTEKHNLVQDWLNKSKRFKVIHSEFEVSEGLPGDYVGRLDNVIQDIETGEISITDTKTQNAMAFKRYINSLPKQNHIYQISAYAVGYKKMGFPYDSLMILYCSTGSDAPVMLKVEPFENITDLMQDYIQAVDDYKEFKTFPKRLDATFNEEDSWMCSYCDFNGISCEGLIGGKK